MAGEYNDSIINELEAFFIGRNDVINRWGNAVASFQALPGLVGFWPMSSVQRSTGNAYDLSGQARTLTYNGNPTYNFSGVAPYIGLDGTGDYLSRADETDLDILGTETIYAAAARGLTLGGWFMATAGAGTNRAFISKASGGQVSYYLMAAGDNAHVTVSLDGGLVNISQVTSTGTIALNTWYFCAGRFVPSTSLDVYLNDTKTSNAVGIIANLFNGTAPLEIGQVLGGSLLTGRASLCFLCANALSDTIIKALFEQTRALFGV